MKVFIKPGKYVLAVSGGVDSIVLLDLLRNKPDVELIVAHFNHGIRNESIQDAKLVAELAKKYNLTVEVGQGFLGKDASEEQARDARYEFLHQVQRKHLTDKIITAHHQDDLIETAMLNLIRGTGARGLHSIRSNKNILRPLLEVPKEQIINYAKNNKLKWIEDRTNQDNKYMRNRIRNIIMPKLTIEQREDLVRKVNKVATSDQDISKEIAKLSQVVNKNNQINRGQFINLPTIIGNELIVYWLRKNNVADFDKKTVDRLNVSLRTSKAGANQPVKGDLKLVFEQKLAYFSGTV